MSIERIEAHVRTALESMGVSEADLRFERPRDPSHGDWATNVAMTLARVLGRPPRVIAEEIASRIPVGTDGIAAVDVAGPGFLNFRLKGETVVAVIDDILKAQNDFGRTSSGGGEAVMVEFVSANPTGLLHLGHGRQAALGDALATLLEWTGWKVHREFYYNDAGRQIERLAESVQARYQQHFGQDTPVPEDGYHAATVTEIAEAIAATDGDAWLTAPDALEHFRTVAVARLRQEQDLDLHAFGVRFDRYYLESSLYEEGRVEATIQDLRATGLVYDQDGAVWLRTTAYGDGKDRVMVKSDGSPTYFLPDVAYHRTKWERGFQRAINVQGADHHGTTARVRAGLQALGLPEGYPEYLLHQMVTVERGGEEVKFSKRAGDYVTLRDLVEQVGRDVTRYFFLMRKPEAHLVFDLDWALDQSDKNPVYKAQYAHARMCAILRKAGADASPPLPGTAALDRLDHPMERELVRKLSTLPEVLARAAEARAPHLVCDWLEQMAGEVNAWYHAGNPARNPELAVLCDDEELRTARVALVWATRTVLANALTILGVTAPERMDRDTPTETPAPAGGGLDYKSAGVDLDRAEQDKEGLKALVASTRDARTLSALGQFGGMYAVPEGVKDPVLVSSADGVGTKLKVAFQAGVHDTVGQCLVNHCVNDILVQGATPLFFLDYLATGEVDEGVVQEVVRGVAVACKENACALVGGETAQMPDFYAPGTYDLAGFIVGIVGRAGIIEGSRVQPGDRILALPSSGLHTNGYSLARKILFEHQGLRVSDAFPGLDGETVGDVLLRVHRSYLPLLRQPLEAGLIRGMAHITGGGIPGNLPRSLPQGCAARIDTKSWTVPPVFTQLARMGGVKSDEMFRVFNMGVGFLLIVAPESVDAVTEHLKAMDEPVWLAGEVTEGNGEVTLVP